MLATKAPIKLTVTRGMLEGTTFELKERSVYVLGRGENCHPRVPNDGLHRDISRHHCLLSVDPPHLWVQDLGSKNGTFVNGHRLEPVEFLPDPEHAGPGGERQPLHDGDEIALGSNTVLRVNLEEDEPEDE